MKTIKTGSDFSGVGAFDYAINRVAEAKGFEHKRVYACDWDKYARITYVHNHGEPDYYPKDVYDREIPKDSLDIYMTSPPCQAFSLAGKRLGKNDERGILFFNSLEFIKENKPRFFIFENVKGLLSDDKGRTFGEWVRMLGGKSVNGLPVIFPDEDSVPYHLYWKVINSSHHGVPQNRERVFLIGIRDNEENVFQFPKEEHLKKRLNDILEKNVNKKYLVSKNKVKSSFEFGCKRLQKIYNEQKMKFNKGKAVAIDIYNQSLHDVCPTLKDPCHNDRRIFDGQTIRKFTPRECFRFQDFPETFDFSVVSDSQAYKQAGNSITVRVLEKILLQLPI